MTPTPNPTVAAQQVARTSEAAAPYASKACLTGPTKEGADKLLGLQAARAVAVRAVKFRLDALEDILQGTGMQCDNSELSESVNELQRR